MQPRFPTLFARFSLLLMISFSVLAADAGPGLEQQNDWQQRLDQADVLKLEGKTKQKAADEVFEAADVACFKKFLVNSCRKDALKAHTEAVRIAGKIENEGKALERAVKKEQLIEKDKQRAEQAPQKATDRQERLEETSAERQTAAEQAAATRANKAKKAEEGSQRRADQAEKHRQKQASHDAKVAAKMEKAARRKAEAEAADK